MKTADPKQHLRHAKIFDLLRQEVAGKRPADRAAAAAARYLDDATAERMISHAVGSLKTPTSQKPRRFGLVVRALQSKQDANL